MTTSTSPEQAKLARDDYAAKQLLRDQHAAYYASKVAELNLGSVDTASDYLDDGERFFARGIFVGQRDLDVVVDAIFEDREWAIVSGLNPSGPLHFGHKAMFDALLWLQRSHGATVYIPITDDETYLVGKAPSVAHARRTALEEVLPSIIALGFDPAKTRIYLHSQFPQIYRLATTLSSLVTYNSVRGLFGWQGHEHTGTVFYMGALQLASILLPQLLELGGPKPVLVPVGIDQHPYISLSRDVARRSSAIAPSELVWRFLSGLKTPAAKMSTSTPGNALFLTDDPSEAAKKIRHGYSGGVSVLDVHRELGAIPEVCAAFELLTYNLDDQEEWEYIRTEYGAGRMLTSAVKNRAVEVVAPFLERHHDLRVDAKSRIDEFLFDRPLPSIDFGRDLFLEGSPS